MSPDLDKKLVEDFPVLYADRYGSMLTTCMCWGFCSGDGWEPLIRKLSEQLTYLSTGSGLKFKAAQVKEKYGTLRFYYDTYGEGSDVVEDLASIAVAHAERLSEVTCEMCGKEGRVRGRGWYACRCPACAHEENYPLTADEATALGVVEFDEESGEEP